MTHPSRLVLAVFALVMTGCTSVQQSFPEKDPNQVWTALVSVARTPEYDSDDPSERWTVTENRVAVFDDEARIEIYRELTRYLNMADTRPRTERKTWQFQVTLDPVEPPTATFTSRALGVPLQATKEAERYFDDVWAVLGGRP